MARRLSKVWFTPLILVLMITIVDHVPKEGLPVKEVLKRIGRMHLIRQKISTTTPETFNIDDGGWTGLQQYWTQATCWCKEHDRLLLIGILKYVSCTSFGLLLMNSKTRTWKVLQHSSRS